MRLLFFSWLLLAGSVSFAQIDDQNGLSFLRYLYQYKDNQISSRGVFAQSVPSFNEIRRDQFRFNNYEQFLDYLLSEVPSLKRNFVLLHHSSSLQQASFEHPRIMMFDGGMVFAVSEHPGNGEKRVEILETNPADYSISMREIVFAAGGVRFNPKPQACVACHGQPAKPLWDPYDFWPNAFGSSVGSYSTTAERDFYQALLTKAPQSPTLSRLQMLPKIDLGGSEENTAFTQYIHQINIGRWMNEALKGRDLESIRYPLLTVLGGCFSEYPLPSFPERREKLLATFRKLPSADRIEQLDRMFADIGAARARFKKYQDGLLLNYMPNPTYIMRTDHERLIGEVSDLAMIRWLLDLAGVNAANISTSLIANDYLIGTPSAFFLDMLNVLFEVRPDLFQDIALGTQNLGTGRSSWLAVDCDQLKEKSLSAVRADFSPAVWRNSRSIHREQPVISRCAKCHTEGANPLAPPIPFEDASRLAQRIRDLQDRLGEKILERIQARDTRQMPPGQPLSDEEMNAMKEFIGVVQMVRGPGLL